MATINGSSLDTQALQYLRKLCSHPLLVLDPSVPEHMAAVHAELGTSDWSSAQVSRCLGLPETPAYSLDPTDISQQTKVRLSSVTGIA